MNITKIKLNVKQLNNKTSLLELFKLVTYINKELPERDNEPDCLRQNIKNMESNLDIFINTIEGVDYFIKNKCTNENITQMHKYFLLEILSYRTINNSKNLKTQYNKYFQKFKGKRNLRLEKII